MENHTYFTKSYENARKAFLDKANQIILNNLEARLASHQVPSKTDSELYIDTLFIPANTNPEKLIVISSAVHGIEGYVGSAIQQMFLKEILPVLKIKNTSFLIIHSINPFGFKYHRRVTENNVDLNRGLEQDRKLFKSINKGYSQLNDYLNPEKKYSKRDLFHSFFILKSLTLLIRKSISSLRQAALQGQYQFPKGLYFGGMEFEPQKKILEELLITNIQKDQKVLTIDLHTGYGKKGMLHILQNHADETVKSITEKICNDHPIHRGGKDKFYEIFGDFAEFVGQVAPLNTCIPLVFEYGTQNNLGLLGGFRAIHTMISENQGFHHGYSNPKVEKKVKDKFLKMFYPNDKILREGILEQTRKILPEIIENFDKI